MIEEFPFTTRVLQTEKDINSLKSFIEQAIKEAKERLASQTWARLTWEQRITLNKKVYVSTYFTSASKRVHYCLPRNIVVCETLSQMQF